MLKIRAYFGEISEARKALENLKDIGCNRAYLDMLDPLLDEFSEEIGSVGVENASAFSSIVLRSKGYTYDVEKAPLAGAHPAASGTGSYKELAGMGARLLVTVEEGRLDEVRSVITQSGGSI